MSSILEMQQEISKRKRVWFQLVLNRNNFDIFHNLILFVISTLKQASL